MERKSANRVKSIKKAMAYLAPCSWFKSRAIKTTWILDMNMSYSSPSNVPVILPFDIRLSFYFNIPICIHQRSGGYYLLLWIYLHEQKWANVILTHTFCVIYVFNKLTDWFPVGKWICALQLFSHWNNGLCRLRSKGSWHGPQDLIGSKTWTDSSISLTCLWMNN